MKTLTTLIFLLICVFYSLAQNQVVNGNVIFQNDQTAYFIKPPVNGGAIRFKSNCCSTTDRDLQFGNIDNNGTWSSFMTVTQSGNVGIGTSSPASALSILRSGTGVSIQPSGNPYFGTLAFNRESATGAIFDASGNAFQINNGGTDKNLHFQVYSGSGAQINPNAFVINGANGNVGIGVSNPQAALDVNGIIQISGQNLSSPPSDLSYGLFGYGGIGLGIFSGAVAPSQGIGIWTNPNGYKTEVMRILSGGNVGIGTINPDQKLSVAGTIHAQAVKVDMTGWSDYVLKPTYNLSPLDNVKAFIDKNHHLPDMPSEMEVVKNGVDLGEIVKLQQKEIEELTLYLLHEHKSNNQMKIMILALYKKRQSLNKQRKYNLIFK